MPVSHSRHHAEQHQQTENLLFCKTKNVLLCKDKEYVVVQNRLVPRIPVDNQPTPRHTVDDFSKLTAKNQKQLLCEQRCIIILRVLERGLNLLSVLSLLIKKILSVTH